MTWCVSSVWSSGSSCVATLTLFSQPVVMCTRDPMLMSNCDISCHGRGPRRALPRILARGVPPRFVNPNPI